ncbi:MAG: type IX secretion system sortase PorU [Saprospiraceae bacterium]
MANTPFSLEIEPDWTQPSQQILVGDQPFNRLFFKGAFFDEIAPYQPLYYHSFPLDGPGEPIVQITSVEYETLQLTNVSTENWPAELQFNTSVSKDRGQYIGKISFMPAILEGGQLKVVKRIQLNITQRKTTFIAPRSAVFAEQSVLRDGQLYKMAVTQAGVYKLTYNFLKEELGVDVDNIDPRNIKLYTNLGGMASERPSSELRDDLKELSILAVGEADGSFNTTDYLLFYTQGPDQWSYDQANERFSFEKNIYDNEHYIFLKVGSQLGRRISNRPHLDNAQIQFDDFTDRQVLEEEKVNLHHFWGETLGKATGSGKIWYGDHFKNLRTYSYDNFQFPNLITDQPIQVNARMALRAEQRSRFTLSVNGTSATSTLANSIFRLSGPNDNINNFANSATLNTTFNVGSGDIAIEVDYPFPSSNGDGSEAWLDFIEIMGQRQLSMTGSQLAFRHPESSNYTRVGYEIQAAPGDLVVWNITNPLDISGQDYVRQGNAVVLNTENTAQSLQEFVAFIPTDISQSPIPLGNIPNQNLHALRGVDMVILTAEELLAEAEDLANHRAQTSGLSVVVVLVDQVYNEFNSGKLDPAAIRDFCRMLYMRDADFRYLLLMGDGSFDHKDAYGLGNNIIPTYQQESFNPLYAFPADDYYGILEEGQTNPLRGVLNISIGRIPVRNQLEAQQVVRKIKMYDNNPNAFREWRNQLVFVADDEDSSIHTIDANDIADDVKNQFRSFNLDKIYLDAFPQVSTPGGNRFPEVNRALNQAVFKGALIITYLGHGGEQGWAQERILNISDIQSWDNIDEMTLLMTATCSFTGYDDPSFTSAGEEAFLNPNGGAFALMTTTRAVFANQNATLTRLALDQLLQPENGRYLTLGEAMRAAKNDLPNSSVVTNSRKFTLIGDPSQKLAIPTGQVRTTQIDEQRVDASRSDTLRALQIVKVAGEILDNNGQKVSGFNGTIFPTVYDKELSLKTLGQDQGSRIVDYDIQKNIIFRGRASVKDGAFEFSFVIPKDINYEFGKGKISYYAFDPNAVQDAKGAFEQVIIGGSNADNITDKTGPQIDVFMNTEDFVFGGVTDADPTLLVKLEDEFGINVVGNSIGHDLEAILDDDTQNTFLLNDFFQSELDDFTKGEVRFPLAGLSEGIHTLRVKAWDVANNSSEGYTEFLVAETEGFVLEHVLNYPNPFTDRTCFQFDHNNANQDLDVLIQIFTVSGRLVKTLQANIFSDGAIRQDDCIEWDGRDDFGDPLAKGVYLYKVKVRANIPGIDPLKGESEFQKLVLLK